MKYPKVDLSRWSMPELRFDFYEALYDGVTMRTAAKVKLVDSGQLDWVVRARTVPHENFLSGPYAAHLGSLIRYEIRELLMHELDECLFIDGVRLTNPHPELKKTP